MRPRLGILLAKLAEWREVPTRPKETPWQESVIVSLFQ